MGDVLASNRIAGKNGDDSQLVQSIDHLFKQVVDSETFKAAPVMRGLLFYLWQHRGESPSEYAIAIDALGRRPDFDPKLDATVRVGIARLRAKLKEFYEREIEPSPFQLTIPLGYHELKWIQIPSSHVKDQPPPLRIQFILLGLITTAIVLAVLCINLFHENRTLKASKAATLPQLPSLWRSVLASGKAPTIVVPSPLFFRWSGNAILIRDVAVTQFQDWIASAPIREAVKKWGPPTLAQSYITVGAAKSAARILEYLEIMGQHPELTDSGNFATDTYSTRNTIFLGSLRQYAAGDRVTQIMQRTNFYVKGSDPGIVWNRNPAPGEATAYREEEFSRERKIVPALVSLLPVTTTGTRSLLLLGPNAAASVFTSILLSPEGLKLVNEQLGKAGHPDSWEMVIEAEINKETVLKIQPVAFRRISASFK